MKKQKFLETLQKLSKDNKVFLLRKKQALDWYRIKIKNLLSAQSFIDPQTIFTKTDYQNLPAIGNIVSFKYDPKTKQKLNYYDIFPLVLIIKLVPGGFVGLNFHYLPPIDRALFMQKLYDYQRIGVTEKNIPKITINMTYSMLISKKSLFYYRACIKRYKNSHIRSMFYTLSPDEWDIALFLPTEKFVGAKKQNVWTESRKINSKI